MKVPVTRGVESLKPRGFDMGLTLVEILVAMGIATVVGGLLLAITVNSIGVYSNQSSKVQGGLNINDALLQIRSSIKNASAVADSYTSGSTTYTTGSNQLVLTALSVDSSGNIISNMSDYFVFFQDQKLLRYKIFPNVGSSRKPVDRIFSTYVDTLNFKYFNSANPPVEVSPVGATKVKVILTLKQKVGTKDDIQTGESEVNLRND